MVTKELIESNIEHLKEDIKNFEEVSSNTRIIPKIEHEIFNITCRMMLEYYQQGLVRSFAAIIQRIRQTKIWEKNESEKARSYIYKLLTSGKETTHIYKWIDINLVIKEYQKKVDNTPEKYETSLKLYKMVLSELIQWRDDGCRFLSSDGQNRYFFAILKFLLGELDKKHYKKTKIKKYISLKWHLEDRDENPLSITFEGTDKQTETFKQLEFSNLPEDYQKVINSIKVILCIVKKGTLSDIIRDLSTDNDNISWNEFERVILEPHPVCLFIVYAFKAIPEFALVTSRIGGLKDKYHKDKKGWLKIVMELIQYEAFGEMSLDLGKMTNKQNTKEIEKSSNKIKEYIRFLAKQFPINLKTNEVFKTKELFRNFYILIQELSKKKVKKKIGLKNIKNLKSLYKEFVLFDMDKRDKKKSKGDFEVVRILGKKTFHPRIGTYIWAQKDINKEALEVRTEKIRNEFIEPNYQRWINEGILSKKSNESPLTRSKKEKIIYSTEKDEYGFPGDENSLDPFEDKIDVDHPEHQGSQEGTHDQRLVATTKQHDTARVK